jgi:hypothetical protein
MSPLMGRMMRRGMRRTTRRMIRGTAMLAGSAVSWAMIGNIRMREADLLRIRQTSGMNPEEMTEEELKQAMQKLGIKELKVD